MMSAKANTGVLSAGVGLDLASATSIEICLQLTAADYFETIKSEYQNTTSPNSVSDVLHGVG